MPEDQWPFLIPMIQLVLNHSPSSVLGNQAPVTVFTGLPATHPLEAVVYRGIELDPVHVIGGAMERVTAHVLELQQSFDSIHKRVISARKSRQMRNKRAAERVSVPRDFDLGDYVLVYERQRARKLLAKWTGPFVIVDTVSNWIFTVQDLVPGGSFTPSVSSCTAMLI